MGFLQGFSSYLGLYKHTE